LKTSLLLTILTTPAFAQENLKPRGDQCEISTEAEGRALLKSQLGLRARDLAASTADEALKWDDTRSAVRNLSEAADLLWENYPERSHAWLVRAWEMTGAISDEDADVAVRRFRSTSPRSEARAIVLNIAQKHDQQLADRLLGQVAEEEGRSQGNIRRGIFDDRSARSAHLLNMASQAVDRDPDASVRLAERSLTDGISFQLQALLLSLREQDKSAAGRMFDSALNRLEERFTSPSEGQVLASYLFTPGRITGAGARGATALAVSTQSPFSGRTPAEDDPARTRHFLSVMQRILLSTPAPSAAPNPPQAAQEFVMLCRSLANGYRIYAPELWAPIEQRMTQVAQHLAPVATDRQVPSSVRDELKSSGATGADDKELNRLYVEGLERAAERDANPTSRRLAFVEAALATRPEELEKGRKLASQIDERDLREQVISYLIYQAALLRLEKGLYEEAVKLADETRPLPRAIILVAAARRITGQRPKNDDEEVVSRKLRALDLLSAAEDSLGQGGDLHVALRVRLGLIAGLAPLDTVRAFEAFGRAVAGINSDPSFNPYDASTIRITGLIDSPNSLTPMARIEYGLKDAVTPLARADFEGAILAAAKISAPAVRGACMIEIARSILSTDSDK
jgi:hypothetical protein